MRKFVVLVCIMLSMVVFACSSSSTETNNTGDTGDTSGFTGNFLAWTGSDDASHFFTLVRVNGQTGSVETIGGSGFFTGLAYGADGRLYGVSNNMYHQSR
jgi:hypothetical protein